MAGYAIISSSKSSSRSAARTISIRERGDEAVFDEETGRCVVNIVTVLVRRAGALGDRQTDEADDKADCINMYSD